MNEKDRKMLEKYAQVMFGCDFDDLSDQEETLLIAYVRAREPDFENHRGIIE